MDKLCLICNAHIDPVWQWEREEGIGAAISTFSAAADFLEEYDEFVFNHNESVLYEWIEKYNPKLFERIKAFIKAGKWKVVGGWYLQPDCNMPNGESIIRHIIKGRQYFIENFGQSSKIAVNFDSFGHSRGLVQVLQDAGYIGYICCRPMEPVQERDMIWKGFNGSEILLHRAVDGYNSLLGKAAEKIRKHIEQFKDKSCHLVLWGVGNHGGGPSRKDLDDIRQLTKEYTEIEIKHSSLDEYFEEISKQKESLSIYDKSLNYVMQGCYTSQVRIKQLHKKLENELQMTEKMTSLAALNGLEYDKKPIEAAVYDLLFSEFHDALPGTSIKDAEEATLRLLSHGLEELIRQKFNCFIYLTGGQKRAADGEYPIFVFNPHPYEIETVIECEMMLSDQNWGELVAYPVVLDENGRECQCQLEKESSNIPIDWRKKVVFNAKLNPSVMNRFSCFFEFRKKAEKETNKSKFEFYFADKKVSFDETTGLVSSYVIGGKEYADGKLGVIRVYEGYCDPWGFKFNNYNKMLGEFKLMSKAEAERFTNNNFEEYSALRVIEDGPVRVKLEGFFTYNNSNAIVQYIIPKKGTDFRIDITLYNNEPDSIIRLGFGSALKDAVLQGNTIFGREELPLGEEVVAQDYTLLSDGNTTMSVISFGTYGLKYGESGLEYTLINSAAYSAHPIEDKTILPRDRYSSRMDIGERRFSFVVNASEMKERFNHIEYENLILKQQPYCLNYFPTGEGILPRYRYHIDNKSIMVTAFKQAEDGRGYIIRFFNNTDEVQDFNINLGVIKDKITIKPMEFLTYRILDDKMIKTNVIEE